MINTRKYSKEVFSRPQIQAAINRSDQKLGALIALLFLTAARISEVLEHKNSPAIRKNDIRVEEEEGHEFLVVPMTIVKRKKRITKEIPIPVMDPLALHIISYIRELPEDAILFDITRQGAWKALKSLGMNPHSLRHSRLTEVAPYFSYSQLYKFAGWKLKGADEEYIHLGWRSYASTLIRVTKARRTKDEEKKT